MASLNGRLRAGLLNQSWAYHRDGTEERWTSPAGDEVRVDAPPGTNLRVVEAHAGDSSLLLRTTGDTRDILRALANLHFIPEEAADVA